MPTGVPPPGILAFQVLLHLAFKLLARLAHTFDQVVFVVPRTASRGEEADRVAAELVGHLARVKVVEAQHLQHRAPALERALEPENRVSV